MRYAYQNLGYMHEYISMVVCCQAFLLSFLLFYHDYKGLVLFRVSKLELLMEQVVCHEKCWRLEGFVRTFNFVILCEFHVIHGT